MLVNALSGMNFIYHLDVYQGKYATNAFIMAEAYNLLTKQKAVINAIVKSGIANEPNGMREIYMDNKYSVPTLFVSFCKRNTTLLPAVLSGAIALGGIHRF